MSDTLQIIKIKNPFNKLDRDISFAEYKNETLLDIRRSHFPQDIAVVVSVNGSIIPKEKWPLFYPCKGDFISLVPAVASDVLKIIAGVILIVIGIVYPIIGTYSIPLGIGLLLGGVIGMLSPKPKTPAMPSPQDYESSQTYRWNPQTVQQQGIAIPKAYGTNKLYGNIIAANLENNGGKYHLNALLCLGVGPYKRLYDFKINDQPAENFQGVAIQTRLGNMEQSVISNFNSTKAEFQTSVKVVKNTPYTYITNNAGFDGLEVELTFPQGLYYANDMGGLDTYSVNVRIELKKQGDANWQILTNQVLTTQQIIIAARWSLGSWMQDESGQTYWYEAQAGTSGPYDHYEGEFSIQEYSSWRWRWIKPITQTVEETVDYITVTGAQNSAVRRTFIIDNLAHSKYEIRVTNLSDDQTSSRYADDMYLTAVREIYYDDFEYPRHVLASVNALATDQLSGSLRFSCIAECARVRIWNGSAWSVDMSDNPAWIFLDIMSQPVFDNNFNVLRYDGYDISYFNLNKLNEWADFCDTLVPDGANGQEKRITFNGVFDAGTSVWEAAMQVCRVGRAVPMWTGTILTLFIDKAEEPSQMFTVGNIGVDSFEEVFLPQSGRAMEIEIDYVNAAKDYARDICSVINPNIDSDIDKVNLNLFGITKNSMAWRAGKYYLAYNEFLTRAVSFTAHVDAIASSVGNVVLVQHDVPQWGFGGRLVSAAANTATIDREVTIEAGKTYAILIRLSDDSRVQKTVIDGPGTYTILTLSSAFATIPAQYDIYSFGESTLITKPFRITDIQPSQDMNFKISAIEYNASIYNSDLEQPALPTLNYSSLEAYPAVTDIALDELLIKGKDGKITDTINVSFSIPASSVFSYAEIWHNTGGGWLYAGISYNGICAIQNVENNKTYQVAIVTVNTAGAKQSIQNAPKASIYTLGKLDLPSNVTNFTAKQNGQFIDFNWMHIPDADLWGYEIRMGTNWEAARIIINKVSSNQFSWQAELNGTYRFLIKAIDESKLYSKDAASVDITLRGINENLNIILSQDEMTKTNQADGAKTNLVYISQYHALMLPHTLTDTDAPAWTDQTPDITNYAGGVNLNGEYISNAIDTLKDGDTWIRIQEAIDGADMGATDQSYPGRTDRSYPEDTDIHITMPIDYKFYFAASDDNISYSAWAEYTGTIQDDFRYVKIKFNINIVSQTGRFKLLNELLSLDVPDVNFEIKDFIVSAAGNDILFANYGQSFYIIPTIRPTLLDSTLNKVPVISNKTETGFHIDLLDVSNTKVAGKVDMQINGY